MSEAHGNVPAMNDIATAPHDDVDEVLELALLEEPPARASVSGELVAPAEELVAGFAATLVGVQPR